MQIYIDSADIDQIREAFSWGIVDGITTNPSLIKAACEKMKAKGEKLTIGEAITRILESAEGTPVSLEVIGVDEESMTREGRLLFKHFNPIAGNVVVKVPVNPNLEQGGKRSYDALKTIKTLSSEGIPINATLIFTPEQAMAAAKAGAAYVSPFAGRIDDMLRTALGDPFKKTDYFPEDGLFDDDGILQVEDNGILSGVDLVKQCVLIMETHSLPCDVLAASLRNPRQVRECALAGADIATIPFDVIREMVEHSKTIEGMNAFVKDIVPEYRQLFSDLKP
ncbi:MAG TPA: transaldolase family protein [Planctomycetota bacterium]|jgi:transaldolase|nr:transaldolase family protein [Planctomycetota bacterium]